MVKKQSWRDYSFTEGEAGLSFTELTDVHTCKSLNLESETELHTVGCSGCSEQSCNHFWVSVSEIMVSFYI